MSNATNMSNNSKCSVVFKMAFVVCYFSMPKYLFDEHDKDGVCDLVLQHAEAEDRAACQGGDAHLLLVFDLLIHLLFIHLSIISKQSYHSFR